RPSLPRAGPGIHGPGPNSRRGLASPNPERQIRSAAADRTGHTVDRGDGGEPMTAVVEARQVLASVIGSDVVDSIQDDDRFFDDQVIDSLQLMELVEAFQSRFGVEVTGKDLSPENFGSIDGMAEFLTSRRGTSESSR